MSNLAWRFCVSVRILSKPEKLKATPGGMAWITRADALFIATVGGWLSPTTPGRSVGGGR